MCAHVCLFKTALIMYHLKHTHGLFVARPEVMEMSPTPHSNEQICAVCLRFFHCVRVCAQ